MTDQLIFIRAASRATRSVSQPNCLEIDAWRVPAVCSTETVRRAGPATQSVALGCAGTCRRGRGTAGDELESRTDQRRRRPNLPKPTGDARCRPRRSTKTCSCMRAGICWLTCTNISAQVAPPLWRPAHREREDPEQYHDQRATRGSDRPGRSWRLGGRPHRAHRIRFRDWHSRETLDPLCDTCPPKNGAGGYSTSTVM